MSKSSYLFSTKNFILLMKLHSISFLAQQGTEKRQIKGRTNAVFLYIAREEILNENYCED